MKWTTSTCACAVYSWPWKSAFLISCCCGWCNISALLRGLGVQGCLYSGAGITGRTTWIMNLFIFEWGDEMKVSLFGINVASVLHYHILSFQGDKTYLPTCNITQIFRSINTWPLHVEETFPAIYHVRNTPAEPSRLDVTPLQPLVGPHVPVDLL